MSDDWTDFLFAILFSAMTLLLLGALAVGGYEVYWDFQAKKECIQKGIPLAACGNYSKHDIKLDQSE